LLAVKHAKACWRSSQTPIDNIMSVKGDKRFYAVPPPLLPVPAVAISLLGKPSLPSLLYIFTLYHRVLCVVSSKFDYINNFSFK